MYNISQTNGVPTTQSPPCQTGGPVVKRSAWLALPPYILGMASAILYIYLESQPRLLFGPAERIAILSFFCISTYLGSLALSKAVPDKKRILMKCTFAVHFAIYIALLLNFTLYDPLFSRTGMTNTVFASRELLEYHLAHSVNIIPFATIFGYIGSYFDHSMSAYVIAINISGNLTALAPMALFLPLLFAGLRRPLPFIMATAAAVIAIELLQFTFATGVCDIDDVMLNVLGAAVTYALLHIKPVNSLVQKITLLEL